MKPNADVGKEKGCMTCLRVIPYVAAGFMLLLSACERDDAPESDALTEADNGSSVQLQIGETLRVSLEANPSTGYRWETDTIDSSVLAYVDEQFSLDPNCGDGMTGCGGTTTLRFRGMAAGQTTLRLVYSGGSGRTNEGNFEVTVHVVQ